jgi:hypothetical protein
MIKSFSNFPIVIQLILVGIIAGIILIIPLKIVYEVTGNTAYVLLFNFDYIPVLNKLKPVWLFGYIFHFVTCICSVIGLYYILKAWSLQYSLISYILVYTMGGGALFFLTCLSNQPPEGDDALAWLYWTSAHALFGCAVGFMIRILIDEKPQN